jgi:hypothetical protein
MLQGLIRVRSSCLFWALTDVYLRPDASHLTVRTNWKRGQMSSRNGDKARFHKLRKKKLRRRELVAKSVSSRRPVQRG